jgi:hypothetical protein
MLLVPNVYAGEDANPYCDLVPDDYQGNCHDRRDASDVTGLVTCNDGSEREFENWQDCPDVSGYDYNGTDADE